MKNDAEGVGVVRATGRKVGAFLGCALTAVSDLAWDAFFRTLSIFQTPPPTREQLYQQHLREREAAITEWIRTHRKEGK